MFSWLYFLLLACIQSNTLSVYYTPLDTINFDEDVDTIPTNSVEEGSGAAQQDVNMEGPKADKKRPSRQETQDDAMNAVMQAQNQLQ